MSLVWLHPCDSPEITGKQLLLSAHDHLHLFEQTDRGASTILYSHKAQDPGGFHGWQSFAKYMARSRNNVHTVQFFSRASSWHTIKSFIFILLDMDGLNILTFDMEIALPLASKPENWI